MNQHSIFRTVLRLAVILVMIPCGSFAQQILNKPVDISVKGQPVSAVLKSMSEQGKFYFSYNSNLIAGDSLVTLNVTRQPVRQVLDQLFYNRFQYKEKGDYLIILPGAREKSFHISGLILDDETGKPVDYASVYSRQLLVSTLSEDDGGFRLRIKERAFPIYLTVSKVGYGDTTMVINSTEESARTMRIQPKAVDLDPLIVRYSEGESTWLGRLFLSQRLRAQSRNIGRFFVALPYQASLTPGLGTHGRMSGQVVNKFSLNVAGGYTAGVNGVEIAGGFNISKENVRYVQLAGAFNVVSGHVNGVQIAGFSNNVLDSLHGVQISGFSGMVRKHVDGVQVSGFLSRAGEGIAGAQVTGAIGLIRNGGNGAQVSGGYNQVRGVFEGVQIAGVANNARDSVRATQISGGLNMARNIKGVQLATFNYAKVMRGVQIGIVNIADSSAGASIGLINIVRKSTSNISVYATDVAPLNVAWKMGTHKFYSLLMVGTGFSGTEKVQTFGAGIGREFFPFRKTGFFVEILNQNVYQGDWEKTPTLYRLQIAATYKFGKHFLLFAGPSYSVFDSDGLEGKKGYKSFPLSGYPNIDLGSKKVTSWIGWQAGISWRYGKL
ncbi:STN and carboxypeptidase regulatory-like domain-containing protein [Dyadobacter jiangsuensis]|uniref:Carboxypeptidase-like protein n=1 Tax=Dyadobacter jiangsuensis TaxID=1591085 RepID=A0A2P8FIN7_9BACT|nr:STN and carboxypeptidase regulatory-like domain-containing protein [Dyadobacter jiangsuensis]PSL21578.1 carboxypeptidase-like protein [Dyadobacter jiangsuensis]